MVGTTLFPVATECVQLYVLAILIISEGFAGQNGHS